MTPALRATVERLLERAQALDPDQFVTCDPATVTTVCEALLAMKARTAELEQAMHGHARAHGEAVVRLAAIWQCVSDGHQMQSDLDTWDELLPKVQQLQARTAEDARVIGVLREALRRHLDIDTSESHEAASLALAQTEGR